METTEKSGKSKAKKIFKRVILLIFVLGILALAGFVSSSYITFSEGTRSGQIQKVSKKGFPFKTFEGQLNLGTVGNDGGSNLMAKDIWEFSVKSDSIYEKLVELQGKEVTLYYKETFRSFFWQGDTKYFIYRVEVIE